MRSVLLLVVVVCSLLVCCCVGQTNCNGALPTAGIWTQAPVLVNQTQNGKLYIAGGSDNPLQVLHLYGSPYDMGVAQGQLLKDNILGMYQQFFGYIESQADPYLKYLPEFLKRIIADGGIEAGLEYEVLITHKYVPQHFEDETKGLADALGISYGDVQRFVLFPELIKAACSIVGAWGEATSNGGLFHLRALDWGTENPFRLYPTLTVYHPEEGNGHEYATLGWNGLLGALTGFSPYMGAGEKVWIKYNGTDVRAGIPWHFLFRDILQYDQNVNQALDRINNATRTCSIFLGLGDHTEASDFKVVEYSHDRVEVFTDDTPFPGYAPTPTAHPLMPGVAYVDKHTQPSSDPCLGSILQKYHGAIDAQSLINAASILQTGDMHAAVFDYSTNIQQAAFISVATQTVAYPPPANATVLPAYARQFIQLDMNALFSLPN